jgi:hypothetical protein
MLAHFFQFRLKGEMMSTLFIFPNDPMSSYTPETNEKVPLSHRDTDAR